MNAVFLNSPSPTAPGAAAQAGGRPAPAGSPAASNERFDQVLGNAQGQSRPQPHAQPHAQSRPAAGGGDGAETTSARSAARGSGRHEEAAQADADAGAVSDADSGTKPAESGAGDPAARAEAGGSTDPSSGQSGDGASQPAATTGDPRALLGWLQGQVAAPAATDAPLSPAGSPKSSTGFAASAASDTARLTLAMIAQAKAGGRLDNAGATTPAATADGATLDASTLSTFRLPTLGEAANDGVPLTPTLGAALSAVLSAAPGAASELVARGVEQFQSQLARPDAAAAALGVAAPPAATSAAPTVPTVPMPPVALDTPDLPLQLGERLQWLVDSGVQEARLQLHPRELGTINVQIRIEPRGASVWFAAEHPAARAALESTLPQLRERFAADGLALGQAQVTAQSSGWSSPGSQQQPQHPARTPEFARGPSTGAAEEPLPVEAASARPIVHIGLVDRYA